MAVFAALGRALDSNIVANIFAFVEDSSIAINCGSNAKDIVDLTEVESIGTAFHSRWNRVLSEALSDLTLSDAYWNLQI